MKKSDLKLAVCMIVLNEEQFVARSILNILHWSIVDQIIIVEGADYRYPREFTKQGLSIDNTESEIHKLLNEYSYNLYNNCYYISNNPDLPEIVYLKYGWASNKEELRNQYSKHIRHEHHAITHVYVKDCDEFLYEGDFTKIENLLCIDKYDIWFLPIKHFVYDDKHIGKQGKYLSVPHQRLYRYIYPFKYLDNHNNPCDGDGKPIRLRVDRTHDLKRDINSPCIYHYGFARKDKHRSADNQFYVNRGEKISRPHYCVERSFLNNWKPGDPVQNGIVINMYSGEVPGCMEGFYNEIL